MCVECFSQEFKTTRICPIFRLRRQSASCAFRDVSELNNYKGISLLSVVGKVFSLILHARLQAWADELLAEEQGRFRVLCIPCQISEINARDSKATLNPLQD